MTEFINDSGEQSAPREKVLEEITGKIEKAAADEDRLYLYDVPLELLSEALAKLEYRETILGKITSLELRDCKNISLLPEISNFFPPSSLKKLKISGDVPENFGNFTSIESLRCNTNAAVLPDSLFTLSNLKELILSISGSALSDEIGSLLHLESLTLYGGELSLLPDSICNLSKLKKLEISGNMRALPDNLGNLTSLESLDITSGSITALPDSMGNLSQLICLRVNDIKKPDSLPPSFANLTRLKSFKMQGNYHALPDNIGILGSLESLNVRGSKITSLPDSIGSLSGLSSLDISHTCIARFPEIICKLPKLTHLDISYTKIKSLPDSFSNLASLKTLDIHGLDVEKMRPLLAGNKHITVLRAYEPLLTEETLDYAGFVRAYYDTLSAVYWFSYKAWREGLLAIEDEFAHIREKDFLARGLQFVVDGTDPEIVRRILANYLEHEYDPYKKKIKQIQMEGALGIQEGCYMAPLMFLLNSFVDIKDDKITAACLEYLHGNDKAFEQLFSGDPLFCDAFFRKKPEREELVFIRRAMDFAETARREGLSALDDKIDFSLVAKRDIFEYGVRFVVDGKDKEDNRGFIEKILDNLVACEPNPARKNFCLAQKAAVLSICEGDNPGMLLEMLLSFFGNDIRAAAREIGKDDSEDALFLV
jgi:Leucine-rich repeat (LRR) protein/flagellar motor component MotA